MKSKRQIEIEEYGQSRSRTEAETDRWFKRTVLMLVSGLLLIVSLFGYVYTKAEKDKYNSILHIITKKENI